MKTITTYFRILCTVLLMTGLFAANTAQAQCPANGAAFGTVTLLTTGAVQTITTCAFFTEYSTINGTTAGQTLRFTATNATFNPVYLTVRSGTPSGPVVAFGNAPIQFVNPVSGTLYLHYRNNGPPTCGSVGAGCITSTVQCISCIPAVSCSPCTFASAFGSATISGNAVITISTCSFAGEYSTINGAVSGQTLRFTSSVLTDCITIHSGSPSGPVIASGQQPLQFVNTFTGTLYAHWSLTGCGTQSSCRTTTVQCVTCTPAPVNDLICSATALSGCSATPTTITGTTVGASTETGIPVCGNTSAPGVWYRWTGVTIGNQITLNTCTGTGYDSWISVYTSSNGLCSGVLTCVASNDDFCGLQSQVQFIATTTTYFIRVHGFSTATGAFTLTRTCASTFNPCTQPIPTVVCTTPQTTTWAGGTGSWTGTMGSPFSTPGQEKLFTFTPPISGTFFYSQIANGGPTTWVDVFYKPVSSGCNNTGWTYTDDVFYTEGGVIATAEMVMTGGVTYYILLDPEGTGAGSRTWWLDCTPPPANDLCSGAIPISLVCGTATTVTGTTVGATNTGDGVPSCGNSAAPGVWYSFVGTGTEMLVQTCGGATWDTWLSAYSGSVCGALTCVANNDDACGLQSMIMFSTVLGQTYYIRVHGFAAASGPFTLSVACLVSCSPAVTTVMTPGSGCGATVPVVASLIGAPVGATIQWQFQVDGTGPWTNIAGATFSPIALNANLGTGIQQASLGLRAIINGSCISDPHVFVINNPFPVTNPTGISGCGIAAGDVSVVANPTPGYLVRWYSAPTGGTLLGTGNPFPVSVTSTTTFYAAAYNPATGCESATRAAATATVYPIPVITADATPNPVCAGTTLNLSASSVAPACTGGTFTLTLSGAWWRDETTWNVKDVNNIIIASGGPYGFGQVITASWTSSNGPFTFFIETQGFFNDNQADWAITCGGSPVISGHINPALQFTSSAFCCSGPVGGGGPPPSVVFNVTVSGTGFLDETEWQVLSNTATVLGSGGPYGFGSTNNATVTVPFSAMPVSFVINTQGFFNDNVATYNVVCEGSSLASGTIGGGQTQTASALSCGTPPATAGYNWTGPNGFNSTAQNPTLIASPAAQGTYSVTYTTEQSCQGTATVDVIVHTPPAIPTLNGLPLGPSVGSNPNLIYSTESNTCNKQVFYNLVVTGIPTPDVSYVLGGATSGSGTGDGSGSYFERETPSGITTVTVTAVNSCGTITRQFRVTVQDNTFPGITTTVVPVTTVNNGACGSTVVVPHPTVANGGVTDNCPLDPFAEAFFSRSDFLGEFDPYPVGTTTVTWQASDAIGNVTTVTQDVVVTNNKPVVTSFATSSEVILVNGKVKFTVNFSDESGGGPYTVKFYKDKADAVPANTQVYAGLCTSGCLSGVIDMNTVESDSIQYTASAVSEPKVEVVDGCNQLSDQSPNTTIQYQVVAVAGGQWTTGGGSFVVPAGASDYAGLCASYGVVVKPHTGGKYKGQLQLNIHEPNTNQDFTVHTDNGSNTDILWDYLTISGCSLATFRGNCLLNGVSGYQVFVQQCDKTRDLAASNHLRIKVKHKASGTVIFDTQPGFTESITGNPYTGASLAAILGNCINGNGGGTIKVQPSNSNCTQRLDMFTDASENLLQNVPNPFNGTTEIRFMVPQDGKYTLTVYNYLGQAVATLFDAEAVAGESYGVMFDGSSMESGVYTYTLSGEGVKETRRMSIIK